MQNSTRMAFIQPVCSSGNKYCPKVEDKNILCFFFKDSHNKRAVTPTLELDEGNVSTFAKFEYERCSLKTEWVFQKTNTFLISFLQSKTTFWAGSQVYVENYHLGGKGGSNHPSKGSQT